MADPNNAALKPIGAVRNAGALSPGRVAISESAAFDVTTTQVALDLSTRFPSALRGAFLTLTAQGGDVYIAFAPGSNTTTYSLSTTSRSGQDMAGMVLLAGTSRDLCVPPGMTHLHYETAAGTAVLRGYVSSQIDGWSP